MATLAKSSLHMLALLVLMAAGAASPVLAQNDGIPREYTNPDEIVTFDRSTPFVRALDVINQFAQQYEGRTILDRTGTDEPLGITIPPMHWRDALNMMLRAKYLQLIPQADYYEIVGARGPRAQGVGNDNVPRPDTALSTNAREIRINAIFFEGNRRALQEIGVDWSTLTENVPDNVGGFVNPQQGGQGGGGGGGQGGQGGQNQGQLPAVNNFDGPFVQVNQKAAQSVSQNVFNGIVNFGDVFGSGIRVQALFSAFEADNLGEILASPTVKVLEGEEGRIQVGQDFSIKQRDFAGNVTDQFFSVGTILNVVPRVIEDQDTTFIHLSIEAERSSAQPDPVSTVINKQNATTQTLLLDNEATVIAGLYRTESSEVRRGIPILKDLPAWFFGLRYLFGYNSKDYQTRELVILIQASIEPGIKERMKQEDLPGIYDQLRDERGRYQQDIRDYINSSVPDTTRQGDARMQQEPPQRIQREDAEDYEQFERSAEQEASQAPISTSEKSAQDPSYSSGNGAPNSGYYVIVGSFGDSTNAQAYQRRVKDDGFSASVISGGTQEVRYMVSLAHFTDEVLANRYLESVKNAGYPDAWLYQP